MLRNRLVWMLAALVMGFLQAWDSGILLAGPPAQALIVVGVLLPAAAIGLPVPHIVRFAALMAGALVLVWARMVSPVSLNTLHVSLMVPALYILFVAGWRPAHLQPGDLAENVYGGDTSSSRPA